MEVMSIKLGKYSFSGPAKSIDKIKNWSGVYAVVCSVGNEYFLVDVGESSKLRTHIVNHDKKDCCVEHCEGQLIIFVHYTPFVKQVRRIRIEQELREIFHPNCAMSEKRCISDFRM